MGHVCIIQALHCEAQRHPVHKPLNFMTNEVGVFLQFMGFPLAALASPYLSNEQNSGSKNITSTPRDPRVLRHKCFCGEFFFSLLFMLFLAYLLYTCEL